MLVGALAVSACANGKLGDLGGTTAGITGGAPVKRSEARFAFETISGPPREVLASLSSALNKEVASKKLNVVAKNDPSANYRIKGYLSAIGDGSNTVLVYVWDVTDGSGRRVHRISGQEVTRGAAGGAWAAVGSKTLDAAARHTIDALAEWVEAG